MSIWSLPPCGSGLPPSGEELAGTEVLCPLATGSQEGHERQVTVAKGWALCEVNWRGHSVGDP